MSFKKNEASTPHIAKVYFKNEDKIKVFSDVSDVNLDLQKGTKWKRNGE